MHSIMLFILINHLIVNVLTNFNVNKYYACIIFSIFG